MRLIVCIAALVGAIMVGSSDARAADAAPASSFNVYIGTYTKGIARGIYVLRLNSATGELTQPMLAAEMANPSFVTISPDRRFLFACSESPGGSLVKGFAIEPDGKLTAINAQATQKGPCHVLVDPSGKNLLVANYVAGSVQIYPISTSGELGAPQTIEHHGSPAQHSHAHMFEIDPSRRFALCCDLGLDKVIVYRLDADAHLLTSNDPPSVDLAPHSGPRHLTFSRDGRFLYTINELASTVSVLTWDAGHGALHEIQTLSTLPGGFKAEHLSTAELILHPSGKFLYGSNRGHDSIVEYAVDEATGKLTLVGHTPTGGKIPRGFGVDPTGRWLIVGNMSSDSLLEFKIDEKTGELSPTGVKFEVGMPVCVKFAPAN